MSLDYDYLTTIKPFAQRVFNASNPPQTQWKGMTYSFGSNWFYFYKGWDPAHNVLRSLLRLLDNPDAIAQSCFGLCSQAAFLRAWSYRDPVAVANFTIDLYTNGHAKIGDFEVSPNDDMLYCSWIVEPTVPPNPTFDHGKWGPGNKISESVWMICCSLANTSKSWIVEMAGLTIREQRLDGTPANNLSTLSIPSDILGWLQKTGCYESVVEKTDVWDKFKAFHKSRINNESASKYYNKTLESDSIIKSNFTDADDIILCINTGLFIKAIAITPAKRVDPPQFPMFPNHYVMLEDPITQSGDILTMNIWTWGGYYTVQVSVSDFNDNYYGSIAAHASTKRRSLKLGPLDISAIQNQRIYYSQDNSLHFEWQGGDPRTEWFELQLVHDAPVDNPCITGSKMLVREILQRVWPESGSKRYEYSMPMQSPENPHGTRYEIVACHAALRPYNSDPFSYNQYDYVYVPCNVMDGYQGGGYQYPLCETQTTHFRLRYYSYPPHSKQIPDGLNPYTNYLKWHNDETIQFAGEVIGHCYENDSTDIVQNGTLISVNRDTRTPLYVEKIEVWLEYFYHLLGREPYSLKCANTGKLIEVTIGDVQSAVIAANGTPMVGISAPATDQDIPGICLKALLSLEFAQTAQTGTGIWPEWIFPPFVSHVAVVQVPALSVPNGYADFHPSLKPCEWMTAYDVQWIISGNTRTLQINTNKPLNPKMIAVVFVKFDNKTMRDDSIKLTLQGKPANIPVAVPSPDHDYYYGSFQPENNWSTLHELRLETQGVRSWQNNVLRALIGDGIDANPQTIAKVEYNLSRLVFLNAEEGIDRNHRIVIGPLALYEPITSLAPDARENNNDFSTATKVPLFLRDEPHEFGKKKIDEKTFVDLNFHDNKDIDYFDVSWACSSYDDTDEANRPVFAPPKTNPYWGLTVTHQPPTLSCSVSSGDFHCLDVEVWKYDAATNLTSEPKSTGLSIDRPYKELGAKSCYFVIKNHDFVSQGAFPYKLTISYASAYDTFEIDTAAPAYTKGKTTITRTELNNLFDLLDLPRPPEYSEGIILINGVSTPISTLIGASQSGVNSKDKAIRVSRTFDWLIMFTLFFVILGGYHIHYMLTGGDWDFWSDWKDRRLWVTVAPIVSITFPAAVQSVLWWRYRLPFGAVVCILGLLLGEWINRYLNFWGWTYFPVNFCFPSNLMPGAIVLDVILMLSGSMTVTAVIGGLAWGLLFYPGNWPIIAPLHVPVEYNGMMMTLADLQGYHYVRTGTPEYIRMVEKGTLRTFGKDVAPVSAFFSGFVSILIYFLWHFFGKWFGSTAFVESA